MSDMNVVVIGASGRVGSKLVVKLRQDDCQVVEASPTFGVNTVTRQGLAAAIDGAQVVVDVSNSPSLEGEAAIRFFETSGRNIAAACEAAGVQRRIALSIVGTDGLQASGYFRAKKIQEDLLKASSIPFTILRSTQFFEFIAGVVQAYVQALQKIPARHEVLLIVNGRDDSLAVCRGLEPDQPTVRVLENDRRGWGPAVRRGLAEARGDLLCYTNSARTSAEDLLLAILYAIAYPGVVVKANRRIRDSWFRRLGSLLYNLECRVLFDLASFDLNATPKVFPRTLEKLVALSRNDDVIDVEFNVICRREGYRMIEVPIFATTRHGGESTTTLWSAFRMYCGAFQFWRDLRRGARPGS